MEKLKLNREYLLRHLFSVLVFVGVGAWFAYDGFVSYPKTDPVKLYASIEGAEPPQGCDVEKFKAQKIKSQKVFAAFLLVVALAVGAKLAKTAMFKFSWDADGFYVNGKKYVYGDITKLDDSNWDKRSCFILVTKSDKIAFDAWHYLGVREFKDFLAEKL